MIFVSVRVGNIYSDPFSQETGVPQGSILSVTLFSLKINNIVSCLLPDIKCSLLVYDLAIYMEYLLIRKNLRWPGHLPRQVLYSQLAERQRSHGRPRLRYKDTIK